MNCPRVLFLCTHNSARSQMAEALLRSMTGDRFEVASAGLQKTFIHPLAIKVMEEIDIELTGHRSKVVDDVLGQPWDYAITVCDSAKERCPAFPERTRRLHFGVEDPAAVQGTAKEKLSAFRWARDQLREWLRQWVDDQERPSRLRTHLLRVAALVILIGVAAGIAWWKVDARMAAAVAAAGVIGVMTWLLWR